ncbi:MAG: hypothetical protein ACI865_001944 [Flavobacteriaceae bacterium]|jgi:hypothetical protein
MYKFLIVLILLTGFLHGCSEETAATNEEILTQLFQEVENKTGYPLSYEVTTGDKNVLTMNVQLGKPVGMMTDQTAVLQKCFEEISEEGLEYDMYVLSSHKGGIVFGITSIDLDYISARIADVQKFMSYLKNGNKQSIMSFIQPGAFSGEDIDTLIARCTNRLSELDYKYLGYELTQEEQTTYCKFIFESDNSIYRLNYNLTNKDAAITNIEYPS